MVTELEQEHEVRYWTEVLGSAKNNFESCARATPSAGASTCAPAWCDMCAPVIASRWSSQTATTRPSRSAAIDSHPRFPAASVPGTGTGRENVRP